MDLVLVKNINWAMITAAPLDDGKELSFADGMIPFSPKSLRTC